MGLSHYSGRMRRASIPSGSVSPSVRIDIIDNPLAGEHPSLGSQVEEALHHALDGEHLGAVEVRFRICRDDADALKFICKVENPPRNDGDGGPPPWRWWSPLLETAAEFREALEEGLRVRRHRLAVAGIIR